MPPDIEALEARRLRYLEWHLIAFVPFVLLSVIRFFLRQGGWNDRPIGAAVLAGLVLCLLVMIVAAIVSARLTQAIRGYPELTQALDNELVRDLEARSWKAAYLAAAGTTVFFALAWFFYPVCDPVLVALTTIMTGAGAYQAHFYLRYRAL